MMRPRLAHQIKKASLILLTGMAIGFPISSQIQAGPPTCAGFSDPGAVFCDGFEDGDLVGWAIRYPGTITIGTPGLNGTGSKAKFGPSAGNPQMDASYSVYTPVGSKLYFEFWVAYDSNWLWREGSGPGWQNSSYKTIGLRHNTPAGQAPDYQGRLLMTVWGFADGLWQQGAQMISLIMNYTGTGGTGFEGGYPNVTSVPFRPGGTYHVIWEVTVGPGTIGRFRQWLDGTLTHDFRGIQTAGDPNGVTWNVIEVGGPQAYPNTAAAWY